MDWKFILTFLVASTATWIAKSYFDSYLRKKGENLATREDVEKITRIVEGVKSEVSVQLELVKWELGKKAIVHRLAAEKEFEALAEIGKALYDLQSSEPTVPSSSLCAGLARGFAVAVTVGNGDMRWLSWTL